MRVGNKNKINIGIIGCGHWGPNFVRNFSQINGAFVKYVCDLNPANLSHIKKLYPRIITTIDYQQILKDKSVNAVVIATPANLHYRLAKDSLLHDKHLLVEKPLALNIKEAKELVDLSEEKKKILMVGHTFRFNYGIRKIKWLISNHKLGKIYYIYSRRTNLGPLRKDVNAMWDLAPHDISIVNYLLNKTPSFVIALGEKYLPHHLEDVCFITLIFPNKVLAHLHVSWLDPKKVRELVVVGRARMVVFDDLKTNTPISIYDKSVITKKFKQNYDSFDEFKMITKNGKTSKPKIKKEEPLFAECRHFIDCVKENRRPLSDGRDGLEVLKVLTGLKQSLARGGMPVSLKNI